MASLIDTPRKYLTKQSGVYDVVPGTNRDRLQGFYKARNDRTLSSNVRVVPLHEYVEPDNIKTPIRVGSMKSHLPLKRDKTRFVIE